MEKAMSTIETLRKKLGPKFRTEIMTATGVTRPTLSKYLKEFDEAPTEFRNTVLKLIKARKQQNEELNSLAA